MRRVFLGIGDEAGDAFITEGLPSVTCSNPPPEVNISTLYMKTYCRACKQEGYIAPRGPRLKGTGPNGQPWALSGDINICGCSPPPVFYAERNMAQVFDSDEGARRMTNVHNSGSRVGSGLYDEQYMLKGGDGQALANVGYRVLVGSKV